MPMKQENDRIRLLIADDDRAYANIMRDYFNLLPEYEVCGCVYNGRDALHTIEEQKPDYVILDLAMPYYDGLFVTDGIDKMPLSQQPYVVILSALPYNKAISRRLEESSRRYFMPKPISLECLHAHIISDRNGEKASEQRTHFPEAKLDLLLGRMGFKPATKGRSYIISAIRLLHREPELMHALTKELYVKTGERHLNVNSQTVEKNIRSSVKAVWENDEGSAMKEIFAEYGIILNDRPSNSVFLTSLLQIIRK